MSMARDTIKMGQKAFGPGSHDQDMLNFIEFLLATSWKCNYVSSLEGLVLSHHLQKYFREMNGTGFGSMLADIVYLNELVYNALDDASILGVTLISLGQHHDLWNTGLILGKVSKMAI
jgi:hypothetical protein